MFDVSRSPSAVLHTSPMLCCLKCRLDAITMLNMDDVMAAANMDLSQLLQAGDDQQMPVSGKTIEVSVHHLHGGAPVHGCCEHGRALPAMRRCGVVSSGIHSTEASRHKGHMPGLHWQQLLLNEQCILSDI